MKLFRSILCEVDLSGEVPEADTAIRSWKAAKHLANKKQYKTAAERKLQELQKEMRIRATDGQKAKGGGFENPIYASGAINQWAGHPDQFTNWTKIFGQQYVDMKNILQRYGVPGFEKMYYADRPWFSSRKAGSRRSAGPNTLARNFVLIADDGRFVWRRYDSGSDYGAAQNDVYIDGVKHATTALLLGNKREVDKLMRPIAQVDVSTVPHAPTVKKEKKKK